jgi:branched-chain amino acid transport system permease protein
MEYFIQQVINGFTLGSIYGLIAIGYTMVYGIIGMINFAHGDIFMIGAFMALIVFMLVSPILGTGAAAIALTIMLMIVVAMVLTSLWNWSIERIAYRPLRGSFRLAPLITAIGMSIALSNFVQVAQGPRNKPIPALVTGNYLIPGTHINVSLKQILIFIITAILLYAFWYIVNRTPLGRAQRACEQDRKMAALMGVDVDRTISITFIMGAALAAVAGALPLLLWRHCFHRRVRARRQSLHGGGARRHRLAARRCFRRPADRHDRSALVSLFLD